MKRAAGLPRMSAPGIALICLALSISPAHSAKGDFKVGPGPTTMSDEEKAIVADPSKGMEHGIVLLDETERDERLGTFSEVRHHFRAKILSNEGRELGDVTLPFNARTGELRDWWGTVILPDGNRTVLAKDALKPEHLEKTLTTGIKVLKGTLPGVAPGCVIDYGYSYWEPGVPWLTRIEIQREWPVKEFRYRWYMDTSDQHTVRLTRTEKLAVSSTKDASGYTVLGKNLPAVLEEPYMPAPNAVRAEAVFYYVNARNVSTSDDFWTQKARDLSRVAGSFTGDRDVRDLIESMKIPPQADLPAKLRAAYDWLAANIKVRGLLNAEEEEQTAEEDISANTKNRDNTVKSGGDLVAAKKGWAWQITYLFLDVARALGAEANVVMATDRTRNFWDPYLLTTSQFSWTLAGVRAPGEGDDRLVFVAPGSGLEYGQVPWWLTGANAWMATPKGGVEVKLRASAIRENSRDVKASIRFDADGAVRASWSESAKGQARYLDWRGLRRMDPEESRKTLDTLCGSGPGFEVSKAAGPDPGKPTADFHLDCEGELMNLGPPEGSSTWSVNLKGPWSEGVPEMTASTRSHPVVLEYPWRSHAVIDVAAPPGFTPGPAPRPVTVEAEFALYTATFTATPTGFRVERDVQLAALLIMPDEYPKLREFVLAVRAADRTPLPFTRSAPGP